MPRFHTDPRNEAYARLIDELIKESDRFLLVDRFNQRSNSEPVFPVLLELEPYLLHSFTYEDYAHRSYDIHSHAIYGEGTYHIYRCTEEAGDILKRHASRLRDWQSPELPEDLCFLDNDGYDILSTVAHERMYSMSITDEEAEDLMERIPGLFFDLPKHQQFEVLLDDAIKHRTDYLCIYAKGITELPARMKELTELETLIIHEQEIHTLPPELFELRNLKCLEIMASDLAELPPEIHQFQTLKKLKIYNGSSFSPTIGWKPKPKEELSFRRLPAEIGELRELESLEVAYSGLSDLPPELKKLKKLKILLINDSLIEGVPDIVQDMPWLQYSRFSTFLGH